MEHNDDDLSPAAENVLRFIVYGAVLGAFIYFGLPGYLHRLVDPYTAAGAHWLVTLFSP